MKTTLDAAGRILVPETPRKALGMEAGQSLEIRVRGCRLEIEIDVMRSKQPRRRKDPAAPLQTALARLTAEQVRDTLERLRR